MSDDDFDADEILREPDDTFIDEEDDDYSRRELRLGQNRKINPEEIPMEEDDLFEDTI